MGRFVLGAGMTAACAILCGTAAYAAPAAANLDVRQPFQIPSQPLDTALLVYSRQSGLQIISSAQVVAGKPAPAVSGMQTPRQALEALLRGANLSFVASGRTITIVAASSAQAESIVLANNAGGQAFEAPQTAGGGVALASAQAAPNAGASGETSSTPTARAAQAQAITPQATPDQVVVTGSRVVSNGNSAPTPVTVMNLDQMSAVKPDTVFEQLRDLPQFDGSGGASGIPTRGVFAGNNNGNASLNLRGLGSNRALVLFDGYRVPPSTPTGEVDINLMPQMLMQRVDVVTGGASAVYGSDAVSGVINFILDRKFNGVKFDIQGSESGRRDDGAYSVGVAAGTALFGGRGHVEGSFQINSGDGIPSYLRRPSLFDWTLQGDGTAANPYHSVQGVTRSDFTFGGQLGFGAGSLRNYTFDTNGVLTPRIKGTTAGIATGVSEQVGGDGANVTVTSLQAQTKLKQFYGRFDYDVTDDIHAFANVSVATDHSYAGSMPTLDFFFSMSTCNPYLAANYQVTMGCTNPSDPNQQVNTFNLNKLPDPRFNALKSTYTTVDQTNYDFTGGFEGKVLANYQWHTAYTFSETKQYVRNDGIDEDQKLAAALDAVTDPKTGAIVCEVSLTSYASQFPGCVPLNMFGPSSESQAAIDYSYGAVKRWTTTTLNGVSGDIGGSPFNDWAGPVDVSLSGEFRRQTLALTANTPTAPVDCSFDRLGNCTPGQTFVYGNTIYPLPQVSQNTSEVAVEFGVPLIKDAPFAKSLALNAGARHTYYQNSGGGFNTTIDANTWKVGLIWDVNDQLTLRWARSQDIRAPNLWELFNPLAFTASTPGAVDYLTGNSTQAQLAPQQSGGNPHLKPEIGLTTTLGMVWRPTSSFSLAVDGYYINLSQAIITSAGASQANQLACYSSGGTAAACQLQVRALGSYTNTSAANYVKTWINAGVNIGAIQTTGIDFEANYRSRIWDHAVSFRGLVSYKPHMLYLQPGLPTLDHAGAASDADPVWRVQAVANVNVTDDFAVSLSERWRSAEWYQDDRSKIEVGGVPSFYTTNLNLNYTLPVERGRYSVYLNIQNLFDKLAPHVGQIGGQPGDFGAYSLGDDFIGRYFTIGLRGRF